MPDILETLQKGVDIKISASGQLPGESIIKSLIDYATEVRKDMEPDLRKRLDAVLIQQIEDVQHVWRGIWKAIGVVQ